jgi:hypothetical protein
MAVPILPGKGTLGAFFSADLKLFLGQAFAPFVFGFCDFFRQILIPPLEDPD